ncbi:MAG: elongation factor P [Acidobacteria bacterium]|nr:elongation factor P [Acidobacteriota bacterium]
MVVKVEARLYRIVATHHLTPGNWRGMVQAKMKDLMSESIVEHRFRSEDDVDKVHCDEAEMEFLYEDGGDYHFMNTATYEQVHLTKEFLGDGVDYLTPNIKLKIDFIDGRAVSVELPITVELKIIETEPELRGATASQSKKPAKTETGLIVNVPPFIKEGTVIRVSTESGEYLEKV